MKLPTGPRGPREPPGRHIIGEHLRGLCPQQVRIGCSGRYLRYARPIRQHLNAVDDYHEQLSTYLWHITYGQGLSNST